MLDAMWLAVLIGVEGWALWSGNALLTLMASLGLLVSGSLVLTRRVALAGVQFRHQLSQHRVTFGEVIEFTVEVINLKPLPLIWLRIEDAVPRYLAIEGGRIENERSQLFPQLIMVIAMLPYERLVRRLRVRCDRRGEHKFGPASLESGDYLGILSAYGGVRLDERVLVFPKVFAIESGKLPSQLFIGRQAVHRQFLHDPMRAIGARAYQSGDPYRSIDWRATAKAGTLMVHILEPSSTPVLDIVLDFSGPRKDPPDYAPDELEMAISVTASLARYGLEKHMSVGVRGNGFSRQAILEVPPSARAGQFGAIMEALAHASTLPSLRLDDLMRRRPAHIPSGATTIIITAGLREDTLVAVQDLQRRRRPFLLIHVADADAPTAPEGFPVCRVTYDNDWCDRETLALAA